MITSRSLAEMKVHHYVVCEEFEYDKYVERSDKTYCTILILPERYLREYDTCDDIPYGEKSVGPGAARNYCWDHALDNGFKRHWVMDDNIKRFYRYHNNRRIVAMTGGIFAAAEDFTDRYVNVPVAGS